MTDVDELDIKPSSTKIITINSLISFRLRESFYISLEYYDDEIIAWHYDTESYASGKIEFEAIEGLKNELEDLFKYLINTPDEELCFCIQRWKKLLLYALVESKFEHF